jgi:hypothetical protein
MEFYCVLIIRVISYVCLRTQKQVVRSLNNLKCEPSNTDQYQTVTMTVTFCICMICPPTNTSFNQVLKPHPVNKTKPPHTTLAISATNRDVHSSVASEKRDKAFLFVESLLQIQETE